MSISEKVSAIKDLIAFVLDVIPKCFTLVQELIVLIKEVQQSWGKKETI